MSLFSIWWEWDLCLLSAPCNPTFLYRKQQLTFLIDFLHPLRTIEAGPWLLYDFPFMSPCLIMPSRSPLIKTKQTELSAEHMENSEAVCEKALSPLWQNVSPIAWDMLKNTGWMRKLIKSFPLRRCFSSYFSHTLRWNNGFWLECISFYGNIPFITCIRSGKQNGSNA